MPKIKCKISNLQEILKLVSLKGKSIIGKEYDAITECVIHTDSGGIVINAVDGG